MKYRTPSLFLTAALALLFILIATAGGSMVIIPGSSHKGELPPLTPEESRLGDRLRGHVHHLAEKIGERNMQLHRSLQQAGDYISSHFKDCGLTVRREPYTVEGKEAVNLEGEIRGSSLPGEIVVIGAHYDSVIGTTGANDNASGVAAMLELAREFAKAAPDRTIRFVAFVNEEPPYFLTEAMGSLVYARRARERGDKIVAMLSLETIGYYSDRPKSQYYPPPLNHFYPDTANFIAFVSDWGSRSLLRKVIGVFRKTTKFPSEGVAAPATIPGIGWSDHWSFWQAGYPAVMITDTALYRYPHYHEGSDTPEKLDYHRMARVVSGIGRVAAELVKK